MSWDIVRLSKFLTTGGGAMDIFPNLFMTGGGAMDIWAFCRGAYAPNNSISYHILKFAEFGGNGWGGDGHNWSSIIAIFCQYKSFYDVSGHLMPSFVNLSHLMSSVVMLLHSIYHLNIFFHSTAPLDIARLSNFLTTQLLIYLLTHAT